MRLVPVFGQYCVGQQQDVLALLAKSVDRLHDRAHATFGAVKGLLMRRRAQGYAVCVFPPDELEGMDKSGVEHAMLMAGIRVIEDHVIITRGMEYAETF